MRFIRLRFLRRFFPLFLGLGLLSSSAISAFHGHVSHSPSSNREVLSPTISDSARALDVCPICAFSSIRYEWLESATVVGWIDTSEESTFVPMERVRVLSEPDAWSDARGPPAV